MSTATINRPMAPNLGISLGVLVLAVLLGVGIFAGGWLGLAGLIGGLFFILFVYHPVIGLYLTAAALILQGSSGVLQVIAEGTLAITAAQLIGIPAIAAWGINILTSKKPFAFNGAMVALGMFIVWTFFGAVLGPEFGEQGPHWVRLAIRFAFFIMTVNLLSTPQRLHWYVVVILLCSLVMALSAILQYFVPATEGGFGAWSQIARNDAAYVDQESLQGEAAIRVSGQAGHSNWLSFFILMVLPLNFYWLHVTRSSFAKGLNYLTILLLLVALVLTFTRTGLLIGVAVALLLAMRHMVMISPLRIFGALAALVVAWALVPEPYKERVLNPSQYTESRSVMSRLELQEAATRYAIENPILGLGPGGFGVEFIHENNDTATTMGYLVDYAGWKQVFIGTHNMYLQLLADHGVIGFLLFGTFFVLMFRALSRKEKALLKAGDKEGGAMATSFLVSLIALALLAVFLHGLYQEIWWMIAAAAVAMVLYDVKFKEPEEEPAKA